jgi:hypothetical protein
MQNHTVPNKIKFTMISIQSKITRDEKKLENMTLNKEKNQSIKTDRERQSKMGAELRTSCNCLPMDTPNYFHKS